FDGGFSGHATIGREGFGFRTECVVHLDSGIVLEAEALAADAYASAIKQPCASKRGCGGTSVGARIVSVAGPALARDARGRTAVGAPAPPVTGPRTRGRRQRRGTRSLFPSR